MLKVILQLYPMIRAENEAERTKLRPIGRNSERYQEAISAVNEVVRAADELGVWGVGCIEHHFHSEGYEVGPAPGIMNAFWGAMTKNVRVGQLGYVMSAQNPIRVAEEAAVLDHLTRGRTFVGFARGYQSRWVNVLGQHLGSQATVSPSIMPKSERERIGENAVEAAREADRVNRDIFARQVEMVLKAWTQESIEASQGPWKIPYPYEEGIGDWPLARLGVTQRLGAPGEVDADGNVRRVSVVPSPYTKPHPPVFVMALGSPESIEFCGRNGFAPVYIGGLSAAARGGNLYTDAAKAAGHNIVNGQNQGVLRYARFGKTMEAARNKILTYDSEIFENFYRGFIPEQFVTGGNPVDRVLSTRVYSIGTIDDVRNQFVEQWKVLPAEYAVLIWHCAQQPTDDIIHEIELFMKHVKPALDELTPYNT